MEWAGAFGDLGTLIPFVVAYIAVLKMDPFGILFSFGAAMVDLRRLLQDSIPGPADEGHRSGGGDAGCANRDDHSGHASMAPISRPGLIWLILGLTGAAKYISRLVPRPVVIGIVLGLGIGFMLEGIRWMSGGWLIAGIGLLGTVLLLSNKAIPAMFLLLIFGAACGAYRNPEILQVLSAARIAISPPRICPDDD